MQWLWIRTTRNDPAAPAIIGEFRKRAEERPDDAGTQFLYAYALQGSDTPRTIQLLTAITEKHPGFVLPWMTLAQIHTFPKFEDRAKTRQYMERALDACPTLTEMPFLMQFVEDRQKLSVWAAAIRKRSSGRTDDTSTGLWRTLWAVEFKLAPQAEQEKLRNQVAEDVKFLESIRPKTPPLESALRRGYELSDDPAGKEKLAASGSERSTVEAFFKAQNEWYRTNPLNPSDSEKKIGHFRKRLEFLTEWAVKLPEQEFIAMERLQALSELPETSDEELRQEGEKALARERPEGSAIAGRVAQIWARRGIELARIPELVQRGREQAARQLERMSATAKSDLFDNAGQAFMQENQKWHYDSLAWSTLSTAYTKLRRGDAARKTLEEWRRGLEARRKRGDEIQSAREAQKQQPPSPPEPGKGSADRQRMMEDSFVRGQGWAESQYFEAVAQLAASEGRKLDELTARQAAIRAIFAGGSPVGVDRSESGRQAMAVWKELGGTDEGWRVWLDSLRSGPRPTGPPVMTGSRWVDTQVRKLPEFSLNDQNGATWTLTKLNGRKTLINVWATWCPPCREELPFLQKLHEQIKEREDLQVITFNVDENEGVVAPFLKEHKYTFPVLVANSVMDAIGRPTGIPTNWIVDGEAAIRSELVGFGGDGNAWIREALAKMEALR